MRAQRVITVPRTGSRRSPRRRVLRRTLAVVLLMALVVLSLMGLSLAQSLSSPSTDDTATRIAEWARDHGLGPLVTAAELAQATLHPAVEGGAPDPTLLASLSSPASPAIAAAGGASTTVPASLTPSSVDSIPIHAPLTPPALPAIPHEGRFVSTNPGTNVVQYTYVRPDAVHTSYLATVMVIDHSARLVLHPGTQEPGGAHTWSVPSRITPREETGLLATFNGGFKLADAQGGYADHGTIAGHLVDGAASLVIGTDGHARIGTWGSDVSMTPDVAYVRQNLRPLISNGVVATDLNHKVQSSWGTTVGGGVAVWRSGLGQTANGDLVYVAGDALTVQSLADLLARAGAVNAMQLDINPSWVSVMSYSGTAPHLVAHRLGTFSRPASRYLQTSTRDFVAVYGPGTSAGPA